MDGASNLGFSKPSRWPIAVWQPLHWIGKWLREVKSGCGLRDWLGLFFFFESPMQFQDFQKPGFPFQPLLFFDAEKLFYATIFRKEGGDREECPEVRIQIWTLSSNFFPLLEMMRHPGRSSDENTRRTLKFISALPPRKEPWHLLKHKVVKMLCKDFQIWMK